jgi:hypothetical protein
MNPVTSFQEVLENKSAFEGRYEIYAFFLYTESDQTLAKYVREHYFEVEELTGRNCLVFFADKPQYWEDRLDKERYWEKIGISKELWKGFLNTVPYRSEEIIRIADVFHVSVKNIPCIVFFPDLHSQEIVISQLDGRKKR